MNVKTMETKFLSTLEKKASFLKDVLKKHHDRRSISRDRINYAKFISSRELKSRLHHLAENKNLIDALWLAHGAFNSSAWLAHSYFSHLSTTLDLKTALHDFDFTEEERHILDCFCDPQKKLPQNVSLKSAFSVVYRELEYAHLHKSYQTQIITPQVNVTIVLISGVLNEIFSTPAFERAAKYLYKEFGIKYICPEVKGTKGTQTNVKLLEKQLYEYIKHNPNEKLWIIGFSKGGVDTLHFLKHNRPFAERYILGLSTIASPLIGSEHTDHKILKALGLIHEFADAKKIKNQDILFKEIYQSLSSSFQGPWLQNNYQHLPQLKFYTALALQCSWSESHIWMLLTKLFFRSKKANDGIVDVDHAFFPSYFNAHNLGIFQGHHLIGQRSSQFPQEALIQAHVVVLNKFNLLK